ncbi:zinc-dependent metalloprotease family protein [Adonisia turfae]|uniref:zinc-dependent metalloprotease family protein n=1 Tax=Adonisia turfae TaxID=2950184 RepID=UPI0013D6A266
MVITSERVSNSLICRLTVLGSVAFVISSCTGGSGGGSSATPVSISEPDQLVLEVQPIQVCDDDGIVCAQVELFEAIADKIWGQAGIDIAFLPLNQLNDSTYLTTDEDEFIDLSFSGDAGDFGRHPDSTRTDGPINLWFVDVIETTTGLVQFGNAWIGLNGVLVSDDILDFNNGAGRIDVIAHELGHNLGLRHSTFGAGEADNVMSSGAVRTVPESIDDIFPDGDRLSRLTPEQIERARESDFLTEAEPDDNSLPITEADAIPLLLADALSADKGSLPIPDVSAMPMALADSPIATMAGKPSLAPQLLASTQAVAAVPEHSPSPLTWLLLLPLGYRVYSRVSRSKR